MESMPVGPGASRFKPDMTPILFVTLQSAADMTLKQDLQVSVTVTYLGCKETNIVDDTFRPITIHLDPLVSVRPSPFEIYRFIGKKGQEQEPSENSDCWVLYDPDADADGDSDPDFDADDKDKDSNAKVDKPPQQVLVCSNPNFVYFGHLLSQWKKTHMVHEPWRNHTTLPPDAKPGDRFRCRFRGGECSWWDWGTNKDGYHEEASTTV